MPRPISEDKKQDWETRICQQQESGLSINEWCRQNKVTKAAFHYWKNMLFPKPIQKSNFTELNVKRSSEISLKAQGIYICIGNDCDLNLRKKLFSLFVEGIC